MDQPRRVSLDNAGLRDRLRGQPARPTRMTIMDTGPAQRIAARPVMQPARQHPIVAAPTRPKVSPAQPQVAVAPQVAPQPHQQVKATIQPRPRRRRNPLQVVVLSAAAVIFLAGVLVLLLTLQTNNSAKAQVSALAQHSVSEDSNGDGTGVPSEAKPKPGNYVVAPEIPKSLSISRLGVNARIRPVGVTNSNQLQAPGNIYDVGWYNGGAKPGDGAGNGAVVLDGHVHGPTLPGVFAHLTQLKPGDTIKVTRGDNKVFTYSVIKVANYDAKNFDMSMLLSSAKPGLPGLNLITCGGTYNHQSSEYEQRTVVFTIQK